VLENGFREYTIRQQRFVLPPRYIPIQRLGSGSYGMVIAVRDTETGEKMAIKRCGNVFAHCEDGKRVLREIKMMSMFEHRNVLPVKDVFVGEAAFNDIYVVTPRMDTDLNELIKSHRLSEQHIKYIMYQVLRSLKYVHSANVLHRDLKPANVLVNFDCHIKLCDFGLARGYEPTGNQDMTSYIVTRWYRAPELLLNNSKYDGAIDIWAAGCILAEMLIGEPLFSGQSSIEQLKLIIDSIAMPEDLRWIQGADMRRRMAQMRAEKEESNRFVSADQLSLKNILIQRAERSRAAGRRTTPSLIENPDVIDMLHKMLAFNPRERWTAERLLDHNYVEDVRSGLHQEPATYQFRWKWDSVTNLTPPQLRQLYWEELVNFHPESKFIPTGTRPATPVAIEARRQERRGEDQRTVC